MNVCPFLNLHYVPLFRVKSVNLGLNKYISGWCLKSHWARYVGDSVKVLFILLNIVHLPVKFH